jgi:hypothetical protein
LDAGKTDVHLGCRPLGRSARTAVDLVLVVVANHLAEPLGHVGVDLASELKRRCVSPVNENVSRCSATSRAYAVRWTVPPLSDTSYSGSGVGRVRNRRLGGTTERPNS